MFVDLMKWNKEYVDTIWYGIKGKHWEPVGEDKYKSLPESANYKPGSNCPWGFRGPLERWDANKPDNALNLLNSWKKQFTAYDYAKTFKFDSSKVKNELAALENLKTTILIPMEMGFIDYETGIKKFEEGAKAAGLEKVYTELQTQIDAYKSANP